jgi:hypothetical protein
VGDDTGDGWRLPATIMLVEAVVVVMDEERLPLLALLLACGWRVVAGFGCGCCWEREADRATGR